MENSRYKQFTSFKLHAILSSAIKSHTLLHHPDWDMNHPFVQLSTLYTLPAVSQLIAVSVIGATVIVSQCLCLSHPYFVS